MVHDGQSSAKSSHSELHMDNTFDPSNDFERLLARAKRGEIPMVDLIAKLCESDLALPSGHEISSDWSGFQPLLFPKDGVQMLACFSSKERAEMFAGVAPYCLVTNGRELLRRIPPSCGLVVNPGHSVGFDVPPSGVARIVQDFA